MKVNISHIALSLYFGINLLFLLKYGLRFITLFQCILLFIFYVIFILTTQYLIKKIKVRNNYVLFGLSTFFILLVVLQSYINPYSLQVDRWSAIHNFINSLLNGVYPYSAQTHLGGYGSPFPIWQLFHLPFYLLGNVGLSIVFVTILFLYSTYTVFNIKTTCLAFLFLLLSPAFIYEVLTRSDLITNFLLVCAIINIIYKYHISLSFNWLILGIILGLIMSTRLSALIPFIVYYFNEYIHSKWFIKVSFPLFVLLIFIVTFIPFLFWDKEMLLFFEYNPFVLQSRQGHLLDFLLFIPLGIYLSLIWKGNIGRYMYFTAILLIMLVIVTFAHNMYLNNNWNELFDSAYDITYFNMSLPFIIMAMCIKMKPENTSLR